MDENQQKTEEIHHDSSEKEHKFCECPTHPFLKWLLCGLLIFLGAFCAFYVLLDWHTKSMILGPSRFNIYKAMQHDMKIADKMMKEENTFASQASNLIHMEKDSNAYKLKIDLKAFDNNADNIQISKNDNVLTITGRSVKKTKHDEQITRFQQSYMFGEDVKLDDMIKKVVRNHLIITIPIIQEQEQED